MTQPEISIVWVARQDIHVSDDRQRPVNPEHVRRVADFLTVRNSLSMSPLRLAPTKVKVGGELKYLLVAGAHRYNATAPDMAGIDPVPCTFSESDDPDLLADEQFLENGAHLPPSSVEYERQLVGFAERHPEYTQTQISKLLPNGHQSDVSKALVANGYRIEFPEETANKPMHAVYKMAVEHKRRQAAVADLPPASGDEVLCGDAVSWMEGYDGPPQFNLIHCDLPYGIDAHKHAGQNSRLAKSYDDSRSTAERLEGAVIEHLPRLCLPDAHMIWWFGVDRFCETKALLSRLDGWTFDPAPLVWARGSADSEAPNQGMAPATEYRPRRAYEWAFFGWRGKPKILKVKSNVFAGRAVRIYHEHEKSQAALEHWFEMVVDGTTRLLDPTCGSGSALRAAKALGAGVFGIEVDEGNAAVAQRALRDDGMLRALTSV